MYNESRKTELSCYNTNGDKKLVDHCHRYLIHIQGTEFINDKFDNIKF